jgi:hypothetical protein
MRKFQLHRFEDAGVAGFRIEAEGVCFDNNQCVVRWFSENHSHLGVFNSPEEVELHAAQRTKLHWIAEMVNEGSRKSIAEMLTMAVLRLHNGDEPEDVADYLARMVKILEEPKSRPRLGDKS